MSKTELRSSLSCNTYEVTDVNDQPLQNLETSPGISYISYKLNNEVSYHFKGLVGLMGANPSSDVIILSHVNDNVLRILGNKGVKALPKSPLVVADWFSSRHVTATLLLAWLV